MRTLNISVTDAEYQKLGLKGDTLSFSEFIALVRSELHRQAYVESVSVFEEHDQSKMKTNESTTETKGVPSPKRLSFSDFSFSKSRKALEAYKGSFSDSVIEERRSEL